MRNVHRRGLARITRALNPNMLAALALAGCGGGGGGASDGTAGTPVVVTPAPSPSASPTVAPTPEPTPEPQPSASPTGATTPDDVTPVPSNFSRAAWIVPGYDTRGDGSHIPRMEPAGEQGAFRFVCTAGQLNYDDPILYPGVRGGSMHLHQWYGNTMGDATSTYRSLRNTGDSTCSNPLNRSAYWVPALMNAGGMVISPDYFMVYYKRFADGDVMCTRIAPEGCFDLPVGLRAVSGYDMRRMGQPQPENENFAFRCVSNQIDRKTIAEAIEDCGGEGQVIAGVMFGPCWNGELDSPDHRSHLVHPRYIGNAWPNCPASHPKLLPTLTQHVAYTIRRSDGEVYFTSDRMGSMRSPGGSTFHADYMEAWDPATRETWSRECLGKRLNCSDGELGDGTMLKRPAHTNIADPRLVAAPPRP